MGRFNLGEYVTVNERVEKFYAKHPEGRINTTLVSHNAETGEVVFRAEVYRGPDDAQPAATGHAFERKGDGHVNQTSHVENCETSAVGRALALLGFEVKKSIASREEMQKVERMQAPTGSDKIRADLLAALKPMWLELKRTDHPDLAEFDTPFNYINHRFDVENGADSIGLGDLQTLVEEFRQMQERAA